MKLHATTGWTSMALVAGLALAACKKDATPEPKGPMEKAGEAVDEAASDTKEAVESAGEDTKEAFDGGK